MIFTYCLLSATGETCDTFQVPMPFPDQGSCAAQLPHRSGIWMAIHAQNYGMMTEFEAHCRPAPEGFRVPGGEIEG